MRVYKLDTEKTWQDQDFGGERMGNSVCVSRYGGFGDMIQMSSILPGLKEQGYSVTVNTTPAGYAIIRNDPHIDAVFLQENEQVPNTELGLYWTKLSKCFSKFIMLSESVEGSLIAIPGRKQFGWHPDFRRMIMGNVDYVAATHAIAEVPMPSRVRFYPSTAEEKAAKAYRKKLGSKNFVILWTMAGSSPHKVWPYMDQVIARLMLDYSDVKVVLTGDNWCQVLEQGWSKEPRVTCKSGKWSIRETLAFAREVDLNIGPETGVLNSVSMLDTPKILMLSHSSSENIGGNWVNTEHMAAPGVDCYPCHQLHFSFEFCNRDPNTGGADCAAGIPSIRVMDAIERFIKKTKLKAA